ncbi:MAG: hypothetical protein H0X37_03165 [Herpetosiphonaceae bacterium]|nr:hypothetical protein [Herpetosiphonaceae bacterium]
MAKSTLNSWFRTEPEHEQLVKRHAVVGQLKAVQANRLRQDRLTKKIHDDAVDEMQGLIGDGLSERELFLTGLALYWAEGNKTQNHLAIANCDPQLIRTFTLWVERCLRIDRSRLRGMVYLYADVDVDAAETYWSEVIGIPRSQFYPAQVDTRTNKSSEKYGTLIYGTVHVKVLGEGTSNLHRKIMGWIAGLGQHIKQTMRE